MGSRQIIISILYVWAFGGLNGGDTLDPVTADRYESQVYVG